MLERFLGLLQRFHFPAHLADVLAQVADERLGREQIVRRQMLRQTILRREFALSFLETAARAEQFATQVNGVD